MKYNLTHLSHLIGKGEGRIETLEVLLISLGVNFKSPSPTLEKTNWVQPFRPTLSSMTPAV